MWPTVRKRWQMLHVTCMYTYIVKWRTTHNICHTCVSNCCHSGFIPWTPLPFLYLLIELLVVRQATGDHVQCVYTRNWTKVFKHTWKGIIEIHGQQWTVLSIINYYHLHYGFNKYSSEEMIAQWNTSSAVDCLLRTKYQDLKGGDMQYFIVRARNDRINLRHMH